MEEVSVPLFLMALVVALDFWVFRRLLIIVLGLLDIICIFLPSGLDLLERDFDCFVWAIDLVDFAV